MIYNKPYQFIPVSYTHLDVYKRQVKCGVKTSQVVYEDKRSLLGHLGDNGSPNGPTKCFCVSGRARWSLNSVVLPSEWSEKVKWVWEKGL